MNSAKELARKVGGALRAKVPTRTTGDGQIEDDRNSLSSDHSGCNSESDIGGGGARGVVISLGNKAREGLTSALSTIGEHTARLTPEQVDSSLQSLYLDSGVLERKCALSAFGGEDGFFEDSYQSDEDEGVADRTGEAIVGKFHQSSSSAKTPESVVEGLPRSYFEKDFDPVFGTIQEVSTWGEGDVTERFMAKIEETDTDKDMVLNRLASMVEANYSDLMDCITHVQAIDVDLGLAGQQITASRRKISVTSELLRDGPNKITTLSKRRNQIVLVVDLAKSLQMLNSIFQTMQINIVTGDLGRAAECAFNVLDSLRNNFYDQFVAFHETSSRVQRSVYVIRQKADRALMRVSCRKFAASEYANIVKAYLVLDHMSESLGVDIQDIQSKQTSPIRDHGNSPLFLLDSFGCLEGLAARIMRFQLEDMDACLRTAVLEFIYASQHERQQHDRKVKGATENSRAGGFGKDMIDLEEQDLGDLYQKVSQELLVPCIVRSCELLADIIHTHYLITQWHTTPFDDRNNDPKHLHRCSVDVDEFLSSENNFSGNGDEDDDEDQDDGLVFEDEQIIPPVIENAASLEPEFRQSSSDPSGENARFDEEESHDEEIGNGNVGDEPAVRDDLRVFPLETKYPPSRLSSPRSTSNCWTPKARSLSCSSQVKDEIRSSILKSFDENFHQVHVNRSVLSPNKSDEEDSRLKRLQGARLTIAYQSLSQTRSELWGELSAALVGALESMQLTPSISLDDFLNMSLALTIMIKLGKEFCNSECRELKSCLENKSRRYFSSLHSDSFIVLRQMLDAETWDSVPINLGDLGGILGIIRKSVPKREEGPILSDTVSLMGTCLGLSPRRWEIASEVGGIVVGGLAAESILMQFASNTGNPLHKLAGMKKKIVEFDDDYNDEEEADEEENTPLTDNEAKQEHEEGQRCKSDDSAETNFMERLLAEKADSNERVSMRREELNKAMVVTQASLNGLTRASARYLQIIHLMPVIAMDIFVSLCQLFDFYLCYVFLGFIPTDDRTKFLAKLSKLTAPPPDQSKDFEVLQEYMDRTLLEMAPFVKESKAIVLIEGSDRSFYGLNARIVAAESCCFAAKVLLELKPKFTQLLPSHSIELCEQFISTFQVAASQLRSLVYRTMCPILLHAPHVLAQIEAGGWETKKVRNSTSPWVAHLIGSCKDIWNHMSSNSALADASSLVFAARSNLVREELWLELTQVAFDIILDGFSRVRKASPEGRAAMINDATEFEEGLSIVHPCRAPRGREYIASFVSAASLGDDDLLSWMRVNFQSYSYRHLHGLATQAFSSLMTIKSKRLKDALLLLDELYHFEDGKTGGVGVKEGIRFNQIFQTTRGFLPEHIPSTSGTVPKISGSMSSLFHTIGGGVKR